jgi:hypothetical protein
MRTLGTALAASLIATNLLGSCKRCAPETVERLPVPDTTWIIETWLAACGLGLSGPLEVRAVNAVSKEIVTIAVIDDPAHTTFSVNSSNDLVITLPNLVYITGAKTEFGGVKVIYNYQWYCDNVASKMDPANRETWSTIIGCPR